MTTALLIALSLAGHCSSQSTSHTIGVKIQNIAFMASNHVTSGIMCGSSSHDGYHHHEEIRKVAIAPDANVPRAASNAGLSRQEAGAHHTPVAATISPRTTNVAFVNRYSSRLNFIGLNYFGLRHARQRSRSCFSHGVTTTTRATAHNAIASAKAVSARVQNGGSTGMSSTGYLVSPKRTAASAPAIAAYQPSAVHETHAGGSPSPSSSSKSKLAETIGQRNLRSQVIQRKNNVSKRHAASPIHRFMPPAYGGA